ncbi:MAG: hypothetical protein ABI134_08365, partial [Byssovorax sp.]
VLSPAVQIALDGERRGGRRPPMHTTTLMGLGVVGLALIGGCALPPERGGGEDGERAADVPVSSAHDAADRTDDWHFSYDETREEVTARRGAAVLVYPLRDMGAEGAGMIASFKGYDGATWTLPNEPVMAGDGVEEVGRQEHDPLVNIGPPRVGPPPRIGPPPPIATPPVHGAGSHGGTTGHGPPPGWNSATWGKACQIAAAMAVSFGCAAIMTDCVAGTILTLGGVAVPCTLVTALACGVGAGAGASLANSCPK